MLVCLAPSLNKVGERCQIGSLIYQFETDCKGHHLQPPAALLYYLVILRVLFLACLRKSEVNCPPAFYLSGVRPSQGVECTITALAT